jgi:predicted lipoprotein with Yx(FWY)xxD motif
MHTRLRRWLTMTGLGMAGVLAMAACSQTPATSPAVSGGSGETYTVAVGDTSAGQALTGEDGKTLYVSTKDSGTTSACAGDCATTWPPFTTEGDEKVEAGAGVTGTFGTITRDDGATQVTYHGRPLYYYAPDAKAGDANGQGVGGVWFIASPSGELPGASGSSAAAGSASPKAGGYQP